MKEGDSISIIHSDTTYKITITKTSGWDSYDNTKYFLSGNGNIGKLLEIIDINSYVKKFDCSILGGSYISSSSLESLTLLCKDLIKLNRLCK